MESEILLRSFMLERFLERISVSNYKHHFILKGGILIAAVVGINMRTTMDMDVTIKGRTLTESEIKVIFEEILATTIDDGVTFSLHRIEKIREETDYPGYRVSIGAFFNRTRQIMKIDITTGKFVTPKEIEYDFKLMFKDRTINVMAYNLETVLAEKFETVITRGVTNTRMRDFYDIYILTTTQPYNANIFVTALKKTIEKRGTSEQMANIDETIAMIETNPVMIDIWQKYAKKYTYTTDLAWVKVINAVKAIASLS